MKYTEKSFSVSGAGNKAYAEGWDAIFKKPSAEDGRPVDVAEDAAAVVPVDVRRDEAGVTPGVFQHPLF